MTKFIIKKGRKNKKKEKEEIMYIKKCSNCGTLYTFQLEDICTTFLSIDGEMFNYVMCPNCGERNSTFFKRKYKEKKYDKNSNIN